MGYGDKIDQVVGVLSRLLHIRGAKRNTLGSMHHYYELEPAELFPRPPPLERFEASRGLLERATRTTTLQWQSRHECLCPDYRLRHRGEYRKNLTAWARWYRPDGHQRRDCLLYVHGWLEPGSWVEEATVFPKWGRELGVDLVHVALPFHGRRNPPSSLFSGEFFWTADLVRSLEAVRQAVYDVRTILAWLKTQSYRQVGVTGLSLGGAITLLLACLEPTPDYIVPIIGHLELHDAVEEAPILWRMKHDLDRFGLGREERRTLFDRLGISHYLPTLAPERQLWIQARDDIYVRAALVERQWQAWGEPPILWLEGGHMTFPLHLQEITDRLARFRRGLLGESG